MKKIGIIIFACMLMLTTACGSSDKTTVCKLSGQNYKYSLVEDSSGKMKSVEITFKEKETSATTSQLKSAVKQFKSYYKSLWGKYKGISYDVSLNGKTISMDITVDYSKMSSSQIVKSSIFGTADKKQVESRKQLVKLLKSQGLTCK